MNRGGDWVTLVLDATRNRIPVVGSKSNKGLPSCASFGRQTDVVTGFFTCSGCNEQFDSRAGVGQWE